MSYVDRQAALVVRESLGLCRDAALVAAGVSARTIRRRIASGAWGRPGPGVVEVQPQPWTWERRALLAVLIGPPGTLASHWTAARLMGVDVPGARSLEVTVPRDRVHHQLGTVVHTSVTDLGRVEVGPHACTSGARVARDLAITATPAELSRVVRTLLRLGRTTPAALLGEVARGGPGSRRLRRAVEADLALQLTTESHTEDAVVAALLQELDRLGAFVTQHAVKLNGGRRVRFDIAWPAWKVALEVDSKAWHDDAFAVAADGERTDDAEVDGWLVLRCRAEHASPAHATALVRRLHACLIARGADI